MEAWRPPPDDETANGSGFVGEARRRLVLWLRYLGMARLLGASLSTMAIVGLAWLLLRQPAPPVEDGMAYATTSTPAAPSRSETPGSPSTPSTAVITVHVAGRVQRPGVYDLPSSSRVIDAVNMAGGAVFGADADAINLAAPVVDGQRVYVPAVGEVVVSEPSGADGVVAGPRFPIDINTATVGDLDRLPGVGPATAEAIVRHRDEQGRFASVDGLLDVPGIGEAKLEAIRGLVSV